MGNRFLCVSLLLLSTLLFPLQRDWAQGAGKVPEVRERLSLDAGWHFSLANSWDPDENFGFGTTAFTFGKAGQSDGPASPRFDDRTWRVVDLPHDWAVELPFDSRGDTNHGSKAIGRHFPQNSTGWYRRTFTLPASDEGRRISVAFDGVYRDSRVWVNGFYLGREASGYASFSYDMTDYLNYGGTNTIVVEANATDEEGWFYEGAGIYRHVWLVKTTPTHVARDGVFVTCTLADEVSANPGAVVKAQVMVANESNEDARLMVSAEVRDATGKVVAASEAQPLQVPVAGDAELAVTLPVSHAHLWSLEDPYLHTLVTTVRNGDVVVDRYVTTIGIRSARFDPDHGFFLNGKHVELKGTNDHQDHAGVGVALPDDLNTFRVKQLKAMGSNAIRTAHNPPTPELLDACDRLGMLVLDENRMMGTTPEDYGQLRRLILRDRNHPSVILWSVGNEEWALEGSAYGERITRDVEAYARRLDPSRGATVAMSSSGGGVSLSSEVLGFNYFVQHHIDAMHARFPSRPVVGTEESSSEHTRGVYADDREHQHLVAYDFETVKQHASVEEAWQYHVARPFSAGLFYWTGFDYRGETTPFGWPAINSQFGMLDTCGFFKDNAFLLQSWWTAKPMVHLLPHWDWAGKEGQPIDVRVYSNATAVELTLNGKSLGRKPMPPNAHLEWKVPYQPGVLAARGYSAAGQEMASDRVETTSAPVRIELVPDTSVLAADGRSLTMVTVRARDAKGRLVPGAASAVTFQIAGPGAILGVGNGDPSSHEADKVVEAVRAIAVSGWKTHSVDLSRPSGPEAMPDFDDSTWERARDPRWDEHRVDPEASVYRGSFTLPDLAQGTTAEAFTLVLRAVGETQSIYVNGHALADNLHFDATGYEYALSALLVHAGKNTIAIYATRFSRENGRRQGFRWYEGGPAAVRAVTPAGVYRRSLFNGFAQVIVQSAARDGEITLTGSSPGMVAGDTKVRVGGGR